MEQQSFVYFQSHLYPRGYLLSRFALRKKRVVKQQLYVYFQWHHPAVCYRADPDCLRYA